jgi:hypothetical protein
MNEEQKERQLDAAYRRASASEAGRPDAKTRAAILAEAAAAARRRAPAANESRYLMRALAGLAVIGVGLLVWRQTDHRLPGEAQPIDVPVAQQPEPAAESAYVPDPGDAPAPDAAAELRASPPPAPPPSAPTVSERASAQDSVERSELEEVQVTGARVQSRRPTVGPRSTEPAAAGASAAQEIAGAEPSAEDLLREHFPGQYQSDTPRRLWLVRNAGGEVTRTGELAAGQQLDGQLESIRQALGARELAVEAVHTLRNARGQRVEISLLRAR